MPYGMGMTWVPLADSTLDDLFNYFISSFLHTLFADFFFMVENYSLVQAGIMRYEKIYMFPSVHISMQVCMVLD